MPKISAARSGVTTAIDTGSAGPGNFAGFRKHVIERSEVRILAYSARFLRRHFRVLAPGNGRREREYSSASRQPMR